MTRYDLSFIPDNVRERNGILIASLRGILEQNEPVDVGQVTHFFDAYSELTAPDSYSIIYILSLIVWRYALENCQNPGAGKLAMTVIEKMEMIVCYASGEVVDYARVFIHKSKTII